MLKNLKLIGEKLNLIFLQVDNSTFSVEVIARLRLQGWHTLERIPSTAITSYPFKNQ
jgi:hypothetical protein